MPFSQTSVTIFLLVFPLVLGGLSLLAGSRRLDRGLLVLAAVGQLLGAAAVDGTATSGLFGFDPLGRLFLLILSLLFAGTALYSLPLVGRGNAPDHVIRQYTPFLFFFLASMTGVIASRNLGLQWVMVEATTLASAPLIFFSRSRESLEAVWKYLFICSLGIALAFMGVLFLLMSAKPLGEAFSTLDLAVLVPVAPKLIPVWLKVAFVFALVGYGTKMGLAPMHTWLPDAHSQAPSPISALLSGTLLNCAFLAILRFYQVLVHTEAAPFVGRALLLTGMLSLLVSAVYILRTGNFKRTLAYSSVEHMAIMATGLGLGGLGIFGAMLHAVGHALAKHSLFLLSGNLLNRYRTVETRQISGVLHHSPMTGWLLVFATLALLGSPPFVLFLSEWTIARAMVTQGHYALLAAFVFLLTTVMVGMGRAVFGMVFGAGPESPDDRIQEPAVTWASPLVFVAGLLILGLFSFSPLQDLLRQAAGVVWGGANGQIGGF